MSGAAQVMRRVVQPLLVVVAVAASARAWGRVPARMPVHWNLGGEVDRYGGRLEGVLLLPVIMLGVWGLMRVLPRIDPRRANYARMEGAYELAITLVLGALLAIHLVLLATALGADVRMDMAVPLIVGGLFIGLGTVLPRARPNWWFGIRTPWTLTNDRVWERTHRVGGYAMLLSGIVLVLSAFAPAAWAKLVLVGAVAAGALVPVVYSYFAWREETARR